MSDTLQIPNTCLTALIKFEKPFNFAQFVDFFKSLLKIAKYINKVFLCLQKNSSLFLNKSITIFLKI